MPAGFAHELQLEHIPRARPLPVAFTERLAVAIAERLPVAIANRSGQSCVCVPQQRYSQRQQYRHAIAVIFILILLMLAAFITWRSLCSPRACVAPRERHCARASYTAARVSRFSERRYTQTRCASLLVCAWLQSPRAPRALALPI